LERIPDTDHLSEFGDCSDFDVFYEWGEFGWDFVECDYRADHSCNNDLWLCVYAVVCDSSVEWLGASRSAVDENDLSIIGTGGEVCDFCASEEFGGEICVGGTVCGIGDFGVWEGVS
jgi:hypothetical protein